MWPNLQETADLVTFTEDIFNGKLHFLCSGTTNEVADFWLVSINETLWWNGLSYSRLLLTPHFLSCKISSFLYSFTFLIDGNKGIKISFIDENGISHTYFCLHLKKNWLKFQNLAWFAASILICLCTPRFLKILMVKSFNTKDSDASHLQLLRGKFWKPY